MASVGMERRESCSRTVYSGIHGSWGTVVGAEALTWVMGIVLMLLIDMEKSGKHCRGYNVTFHGIRRILDWKYAF